MFRTVKYTLPSFWASPLMYGEYDGLDGSEERSLEAFRKDNSDLYLVSVEDDVHFASWHDATQYNVLPTEVCTFIFHSMV